MSRRRRGRTRSCFSRRNHASHIERVDDIIIIIIIIYVYIFYFIRHGKARLTYIILYTGYQKLIEARKPFNSKLYTPPRSVMSAAAARFAVTLRYGSGQEKRKKKTEITSASGIR